jgi:hypothetical protein
MPTESRGWFGSTIGLGGGRKFGGALAEGRDVGERPHVSLSAGFLAKNARNGAPSDPLVLVSFNSFEPFLNSFQLLL